jgi:hypothetical protein
MSNLQQQDGVDERNIKLEKWRPEGSDSVIVALAVIAGNLDSTIETYNKFLEQNISTDINAKRENVIFEATS